jgi:hypothetical protein
MASDDELLECTFLIPLVRNSDRQLHQPLCWGALEDALYSEFGGLTGPQLIYRAIRPVRGQYQDDVGGRVYDESWQYLAVVPRGRLNVLRRILRQAANTFDQESIYLTPGHKS